MKARRIWPIAFAAFGLFALTISWQHKTHTSSAALEAANAQVPQPISTFKLVWSTSITNYRSANLSSDGKDVVTVSNKGHVRLWDWSDHPKAPLWVHAIPDASEAVVGSDGVIAYSSLDPLQHTLFFLNNDGKFLGRSELDSAIWDVALSPDGEFAAAATDQHSLYLVTLGMGLSKRQWKLPGIGDSLSLTSDAASMTAGTWDTSGVTSYTPKGAAMWSYPDSPADTEKLTDRLFETQIADGGMAVMGLSYANVHHEAGKIYYWRGQGNGRPIWTYSLGDDTSYPQALISQDGSAIAVSYSKLVTHGDQSVTERMLVVLDSLGNILWEKGGLIFSPQLVSISSDGKRVTVSNGKNTLYHLDSEGRITAPYQFHSQIVKTVGTADGRWLLVYTSDGSLNLLQLG